MLYQIMAVGLGGNPDYTQLRKEALDFEGPPLPRPADKISKHKKKV